MKKTTYTIILFALSLIVPTLLFGQRQRPQIDSSLVMDFEKYDPVSTLVVPENPVTRAKFRFVDIHSHHWRMQDPSYLDKVFAEMDSLNMGAIVNLSGRGGARLKADDGYRQSTSSKRAIYRF